MPQTLSRACICSYDPEDKWVTKGIVLGLLIMAAGIIAF